MATIWTVCRWSAFEAPLFFGYEVKKVNIKGFKKCYNRGCKEEAFIFMLRKNNPKITSNSVGYCKKHYGDGSWIKRQKLFPLSKPFTRKAISI